MKSVSIIIPNWNGADLLCAYLPSVLAATKKFGEKAEVIVVDDASTDASVNLLQEKFPSVKQVVHYQNKGFGKACWSGVQAAEHPVLIFLNSDVEVGPDFIDPLANSFDDETVFAASPLIFDERGKLSDVTISIPYFRRGKIRYKSFSPQQLLNHVSLLPNPWYTLFPSGCAFAVDRARFLELEGFDDLFNPFYYEDTDLGFRAWRRGLKCIVVPESRVIHYHQGTIASSFKKFRVSAIRKRNRLFYLWKNLTSARLLRNHLLFQLLRFCYRPFCLDGMIVIATFLAIPGFRKAMRRRRLEQAYIVNSEEEIFQIINSAFSTNRLAIETASSSGFTPVIE
jgi:GT2 family glycosyltransferase